MEFRKTNIHRKFFRVTAWLLFFVLLSSNTVFGSEGLFKTNLQTVQAEEIGSSVEENFEEGGETVVSGGDLDGDTGLLGVSSGDSEKDSNSEAVSQGDTGPSDIQVMGEQGMPMVPFGGTISGDITHLLDPMEAVLSQGEPPVVLGETDFIDSTQELFVKIAFPVPVKGDLDNPTEYVERGDYANFEVSEKFLLLGSSTMELKFGAEVVGHITFVSDPDTKKVMANIAFDGEILDDESINSVYAEFTARLQYDGTGPDLAPGNHIVSILGKLPFIVNVPMPPVEYTVTKTADETAVKDGRIEWSVTIGATQEGNTDPIDLSGFKFVDNLHAANIGNYIPGTFTVEGVSVTPDLASVPNGNELSHVFPPGTTAPQTIVFETDVPEGKYYGSGNQTITNTAYLRDAEDNPLGQNSRTVTFTPNKWIEKSGSQTAGGNPENGVGREITWVIVANHDGASLTNAVIKDTLPTGLTFKEARWEKWDGTAWVDSQSISPSGTSSPADEYALNNINSRVRLTIITTVQNESAVTNETTFNNSASITWDGAPGPGNNGGLGIGPIGVTVGYPAITKSGTVNVQERTVNWTINVDIRGQATLTNPKVYDLLVYGSSGFNKNTAVWPWDTGTILDIDEDDINQIRYNQKFDSITSLSTGITHTVHPVYAADGITRIADLVEFTGLSTIAANVITFKSEVLNPDIFASNTSNNRRVENTAILSAGGGIYSASANPYYNSRILYKEMLQRDSVMTPAAGVNNRTTTAADGFHYIDKSVVFRLNVNAEGIDWTDIKNGSGTSLGKVTVTDTLPAGWEFVPFEGGENYFIFEGTKSGTSGSVNAVDSTPDSVSGLDATISGGSATFEFDPLTRAYVILVKARPNAATLKDYFDGTETNSVNNSLNFQTETWTPGVSVQRGVSVTSQVLSKTSGIVVDGVLKWTIKYQPYNMQVGNRIEDTLSEGMELRRDSYGNLIITGNIVVHEMNLQANGSYSQGDPVILTTGPGGNLSYDIETRTLTFIFPDSAKAYEITYLTDLTGEFGQNVTNEVKLLGGDTPVNHLPVQFGIRSFDASATLNRNGHLEIRKTEGTTLAGLQGAEFTLYAMDGSTVVRKGTTDASGILKLKVIPDGTYFLRETEAPAGYVLEGINHTVTVTTVGSVVTTSIDGSTNILNSVNYLTNDVGSLRIGKTVAGTTTETGPFNFTVLFNGTTGGAVYPYNKDGVFAGNIISGGTISLSHGESIVIPNLPKDMTYQITEQDYTNSGWVTASSGASGTIAATVEAQAVFTNTKNLPGLLTFGKTVTGTGTPAGTEFNFTVTLSDKINVYNWEHSNGVDTGTITGSRPFKLKDGESITILDLLEDVTYEIEEVDYPSIGYTTTIKMDGDVIEESTASGTIATAQESEVEFTNFKNLPGSLSIKKIVTGTADIDNTKFEFTVTLSDEENEYIFEYEDFEGTVTSGIIKGEETFALAHNEEVHILDILEGVTYTVTEDDYAPEGYTTLVDGDSTRTVTGEIETDEESQVVFENTKNLPGDLSISKVVFGNDTPEGTKFEFKVTISDKIHEYAYEGFGGAESGTIPVGGEAVFELADGESITIRGLLEGVTYEIEEVDYSLEGYATEVNGIDGREADGAIDTEVISSVMFHNTKWKPGELVIGKTVTGNQGDRTRKFDFTVTLGDKDNEYTFTGENGAASGKIRGEAVISLADGETVTIDNLPYGMTYSVTENDYSGEGYVTTVGGTEGRASGGTIPTDEKAVISYENKKEVAPDPEKPIVASMDKVPKTGDNGSIQRAILGMAIFSALIVVLYGVDLYLRKNQNHRRR